jgi:putative endonuclease
MSYFVYILYSAKLDKYYVGQTSDVDARLAFHNDVERNKIWSARGIPWELKLQIECLSRGEAAKLERLIKSKKSKKFIDRLVNDEAYRQDFLQKNVEQG